MVTELPGHDTSCTSDAYVTIGSPTTLSEVDLSTEPITFNAFGTANVDYKAVGFNPVSGTVTTIGPTGRTENFDAMFGAPNGVFGFAISGGLVQFDPDAGARTLLGASPALQNGDAARCVTTEVTFP